MDLDFHPNAFDLMINEVSIDQKEDDTSDEDILS